MNPVAKFPAAEASVRAIRSLKGNNLTVRSLRKDTPFRVNHLWL